MGDDNAAAAAVAAPAPAPDGSVTAPESKKRPRADPEPPGDDLGRVAEIVMVLSAMGRMRGGGDPTAAERALMAEAREKLSRICESVELHYRRELFTKEMAVAVVVDHGLNPPKENFPRPPKLSIAEKVANTKRKMEEVKEISTQPSLTASQLLHVNFGVKPDARGSLFHGAQRFLQDNMEEVKEIATQPSPSSSQLLHVNFGVKPDARGPLFQGAQRFLQDNVSSIQSGGLQTTSSGGHVPSLSSATSLLQQSQVIESQQCVPPLKASSIPSAPCSGSRLPEKASSVPMQATPVAVANSVLANKVQHTAVKVESVPGVDVFQPSAQLVREQDSNTYTIQTTPGNQHGTPQLAHGANFHEPSVLNNHNEISKMVQRILPAKAFDQPTWTLPSTDYINKPLNCQICKIIISDVESLLVCDACEKGMHMKCLLSYNQRIVPKAEWHCPQCLSSSSGKPLPPKYGRVTRSNATSRSSSSIGSAQASSEKKADIVETKGNSFQKMSLNGNSGLVTRSHASAVGNGHAESAMIKKMPDIREQKESDYPVGDKVENDTNKEVNGDHLDGRAAPTIRSGLPVSDPNHQNLNSGLLPCQMWQQASDCCMQTKVDSKCDNSSQIYEATLHSNPTQAPNASQTINEVDDPMMSNISCNHTDDELKDLSDLKKTSIHGGDCDTRENMIVSQETMDETLDRESSGPSSADSHNIEWVGDAVRTVEEGSYYQSCHISGAIYELQDYALISSNNDSLLPSKLQAFWEDRSGAKWAKVHHFYYNCDLPQTVPRPAIPEINEVYESNNASTILVESIRGPCHVLPLDEFKKASEKRNHSGGTSVGLNSVFLCRWSYDESKGTLQSFSH